MVYHKGKAYKLDDVEFIIPKDSYNKYTYLEPWIIKSKDESINLIFTRFNGKIKVEDKEVEFNNLIFFAEVATNHW